MLKIYGVRFNSGEYMGRQFDNVYLECINDEVSQNLLGGKCESVKFRKSIFNAMVPSGQESQLIGRTIAQIDYDKYGNAQKFSLIKEKE